MEQRNGAGVAQQQGGQELKKRRVLAVIGERATGSEKDRGFEGSECSLTVKARRRALSQNRTVEFPP
jgi:hypothetical protein